MAKISPCFSDILFPGPVRHLRSFKPYVSLHFFSTTTISQYDQGRSCTLTTSPGRSRSPSYTGAALRTAGTFYDENFHSFPRFRFVGLARNHSDIIDARITAFVDSHFTEDCDRDAIVAEYDIGGPVAPKEEIYQFKYLLDVDGNTFSGRYFGLLRSGSLVFKSTAFVEYFSDWLHPYEHCIPVRAGAAGLVRSRREGALGDRERGGGAGDPKARDAVRHARADGSA
ncbi:hypothetical protein B0H11DRAFT_430272 [Mycena galericulata]|nr:hypothetical protein B0H11DRAFT_430272 [Mycena galericulata]